MPCQHVLRWFQAEDHQRTLERWGLGLGIGQPADGPLLLDMFGAVPMVSRAWASAGFRISSFSFRQCSDHDICSEVGFRRLLESGLRLLAPREDKF